MLPIRTTDKFDEDVRRLNREGKDLEELWAVVRALQHGDEFDREAYRDHSLHGEWAGVRELHIRGDWLLMYQIDDDGLKLLRTGTHSDLFRSW